MRHPESWLRGTLVWKFPQFQMPLDQVQENIFSDYSFKSESLWDPFRALGTVQDARDVGVAERAPLFVSSGCSLCGLTIVSFSLSSVSGLFHCRFPPLPHILSLLNHSSDVWSDKPRREAGSQPHHKHSASFRGWLNMQDGNERWVSPRTYRGGGEHGSSVFEWSLIQALS